MLGDYGVFNQMGEDLMSLEIASTWHVLAEDMRYAKNKVIQTPEGPKEFYRGPVIYQARNKNVIVDDGRKEVLKDIFGFGAVASFLAGSVGSSNVTPTDASLVRLDSELIANAQRKGITDTSETALDATDIVSEISGSNRWKIVAQFIFETTDSNNGSTFAEYGIHSTTTLPGTPTTQSGTMFARFVPTSSFVKTAAFRVTVIWTIRA